MGIAKNVVNFLGKKMNSLRVEPICGAKNTHGSTYKERNFPRGCAITITVCDCPETSNTYAENS